MSNPFNNNVQALPVQKKGAAQLIEQARTLKEAYVRLIERETFRPGELVTQKTGLALWNLPVAGEPAVVLEVLPKPIVHSDDPTSPFYRLPLDLVIGISVNGHVLPFHVDSGRFTHWQPPAGGVEH